jgi:hypothetical protein
MYDKSLLFKNKLVKMVAKDILTFLTSNKNYQSTIVHGFSVGGYLWGEALYMMAQNAQKYDPVLHQIRGKQVIIFLSSHYTIPVH